MDYSTLRPKGEYTLYDFTESMDRVGFPLDDILRVVYAWGESGDYAEWSGGFIIVMKTTEEIKKITGWCDTTGWGCQDGATVNDLEKIPSQDELQKEIEGEVDCFPMDLNYALLGR